MASTPTTTTTPAPPAPTTTPAPPASLTDAERDELAQLRAERNARLAAEATAVAPVRTDETVPGGRYEVNGIMVNCEGKPVKE
jgi:hypothetical protein